MIKWNFGGNRDLASKYRGEGVRLLAQLKMGVQPFISRLFPDGTEIQVVRGPINDMINITSPFFIKQVEEITLEGYLPILFLYIDSNTHAAWIIRRNGTVLTPLYFDDLSNYITKREGGYRNPSTIQSNPEYNLHYACIEDKALQWGRVDSEDYIPHYGKLCYNGTTWVIVGDNTCFRPIGWSVSNKDFEYAGESYYGADRDCGSRTNFITYDDPLDSPDLGEFVIKDLSALRVYPNFQTMYNTAEGAKTKIISLWSAVYSALTPTLLIGTDNGLYETHTYGTSVGSHHCCDGYYADFLRLSKLKTYYFGSVILDYASMDGTSRHTVEVYDCSSPCSETPLDVACIDCPDISNNYPAHTWGYEFDRVGPRITMMDYANENGDEAFVCIYQISSTGNHNERDYTTYSVGVYSGYDKWWAGALQEYILAYRVNGVLNKVFLSTVVSGTYSEDVGSHYVTTGFIGKRVRKVSCYNAPDYLVYTYVLQNYIGPLEESHLYDVDDVSWEFEKRVIGVISKKDGLHTVHEMTDELLGKTKGEFDKTIPSAIGLHIKTV